MPDEKEYLTPEEACTYLGVTRRTLDRYADNKRIKRYRRGITRAVLFKRSELDALLQIRPDQDEEDS
jgi:excisionase family DNA binding protein